MRRCLFIAVERWVENLVRDKNFADGEAHNVGIVDGLKAAWHSNGAKCAREDTLTREYFPDGAHSNLFGARRMGLMAKTKSPVVERVVVLELMSTESNVSCWNTRRVILMPTNHNHILPVVEKVPFWKADSWPLNRAKEPMSSRTSKRTASAKQRN